MLRTQKSGLTDRQKRFVAEYLVDLNATQAAIRAGYSEKTANKQGPRLLVNVGIAEAICKGQEKKLATLQLKAEEVIETIRETISRCKGKKGAFNPHAILKGCELLGKHLKLWTDRVEASGPDGGPISLELKPKSLAELAAQIQLEMGTRSLAETVVRVQRELDEEDAGKSLPEPAARIQR